MLKYSILPFYLIIILLVNNVIYTSLELVVNVKNLGGEIFQETIIGNVTEDTVHLQFQQPDGTIITQLIDFKNDIQILNAILLGEEEQRDSLYHIICFVTHFKKSDFIPPDAMAKLRQKNPWTVRVPEKDIGKENVTLDVLIDSTNSDWISPHIKNVCKGAKDTTYGRREELEALISAKVADQNGSLGDPHGGVSFEANDLFLRTVKPFSLVSEDCNSLKGNLIKPCLCQLDLCINWYPCSLKYCRGRDSGGKAGSYRCGIHTCKQCRHYFYSTLRKSSCYWHV